MKIKPRLRTNIVAPNLPPGTVLGQPFSQIFEAKIKGDTMKGEFYFEYALGSGIHFTGIRETKVGTVGPTTK